MSQQTPPPWIDPRLRDLPARPWRKVHLDYHNSQHMPSVGEHFDADEFGDRLIAAHVDAIVVFAKDMHGYFYYPSAYGPVHPGLKRDLLGEQVRACRERNIKVYAYYCVTWDNYLAEHHPEWLVWKRDRTTYLPKFDEPPGWTALCLSNTAFVDLVLAHSHECVERYDLDGIWYDMPLPVGGECFCSTCLQVLRADGLDPMDTAVQREHKQALLTDFLRQTHEQAHAIRPGIQVDHNNQTRFGLAERTPYLDNIDIEALPTSFWGYLYYPTNVRYARTFGTSVCGMTGRFYRSWADFGGLKHPTQLHTELAGIIAQGAQCDIGDQLPPDGQLDAAVYATIGECYARIEHLEPWLDRAVPVTEAAIVVRGLPLENLGNTEQTQAGPLGTSVFGVSKLLIEDHIQFDVVEGGANLDRYRLLVLPDGLEIDEDLAAALRTYRANGGAMIAIHDALRLAGTERAWADDLPFTYDGESPFKPAYMRLGEQLRATLPDYEWALYDGSAQWQARSTAVGSRLAQLGEPLFQRSGAHYTSHGQTPVDHFTDYAAVFRHERMAAVAFPLGASYYRHGYWIYREVFRALVREVYPERLLETNAPLSTEVTVTHQIAERDHPERYLVHIVNFSPNRRSPEHCEYLEDPIPLHDIEVAITLPHPATWAYLAADGTELTISRRDGRTVVVVPRIAISAVVVLE